MKVGTVKILLLEVALLYGAAIVLAAHLWGPELVRLGWIVPTFFILYESVYALLLGRFGTMEANKVALYSLALRGVKFVGVAVIMLVWVWTDQPCRGLFLIYTLIYYLLTSLFEGWATATLNKNNRIK